MLGAQTRRYLRDASSVDCEFSDRCTDPTASPPLSFHFPRLFSTSLFPCPSLRLLLRSSFPSCSCSCLSRRCLNCSSERHRYFSPVSQRQLTAAGRSPVPSCTAADKDPMVDDEQRKHTRAGQSAGSPVVADCIGRAPVLLSSIPPVR